MKKNFLVLALIVPLFFSTVQIAHASFFGNLYNNLFGVHSTVPATSLEGSVEPTTYTQINDNQLPVVTTPSTTTVNTTITPSRTIPATPPTVTPCTIASFAISPTNIAYNGTAKISWNLAGTCSGVSWEGADISSMTSDNENIGPLTKTTTYTLIARGQGGTQTKSITVTVAPKPVALPSATRPFPVTTLPIATPITPTSPTLGCVTSSTPTLTVLSPNGGEVYQAGQQVTVNWKSCGVIATVVGVYLENINTTALTELVYPTANNGSAVVTLPTGVQYGKNFKIYVSNDASGGDYSDDTFTINANSSTTPTSTPATGCGTAPGITVLSPNGGETYQAGQQIAVSWETCNLPATAMIGIDVSAWNADHSDWKASTNLKYVSNSGSTTFTLPTTSLDASGNPYISIGSDTQIKYNAPLGKYYGIEVVAASTLGNNMVIGDDSDTLFTVNASSSTPIPTPPSTLPAGCTSTTGYSPTTGVPCNTTQPTIALPAGCLPGYLYSSTTGQSCTVTTSVPINTNPVFVPYNPSTSTSTPIQNDHTPRIMYWYGKVNQHIDNTGIWQSDPDGTSGADIDQLSYCKKWYPNTISVAPYENETISTWRRASMYEQSGYTATEMSYQCVQGGSVSSARLTVSKDVNDSGDKVIAVNQTASTLGAQFATIDLYAPGSAINVTEIPVTLSATGKAATGKDIVTTLRLYDMTGRQIDSEPVLTENNQEVVVFKNLNVSIDKRSTIVLQIRGDIAPTGSSGGLSGQVAIGLSTDNVTHIKAYDSANQSLSSSSLVGSTVPNQIYLYTNGINVASNGTPTAIALNPGGARIHSTVSFSIPFSVTSFGQTAYIPSTASAGVVAGSARGIQFCLGTSSSACLASGTGIISYTGSDTLSVDGNGNYQIPMGQTKNFTLVMTYEVPQADTYRAVLVDVPWNTTDSGSNYSVYTAGFNGAAFKTPYVAAQ